MAEESFESARDRVAAEIDVGGGDIGDLINGAIAQTVNDMAGSREGATGASPIGSVLLNCMLALDGDGGHLEAARDLFLGQDVDVDGLLTDSELTGDASHGEPLMRSAFEKAYELRVRLEIQRHARQISQLVVLWLLEEPEASASQDFASRLEAAMDRVADAVPAEATLNELVSGTQLSEILGPAAAALAASRETTERAQRSAEYEVAARSVSADMLEAAYLWNPSRGLLVSKANDHDRPYETYLGTFPDRLGEYAPDPHDENLCWPALVRQLTPPKSAGGEEVTRSALTGDGWLLVAKRFEGSEETLAFDEAVACAKALSVIRHDCERAGWTRREVMDGWNGVREDATPDMVDSVCRAHAQLAEACPSQARALMPCRGRLLTAADGGYEAIDNSGGDCLTERFANRVPSRSWLTGTPLGQARLVDGMLASLALHGTTVEDLEASTKASPARIEGSLARAFGNAAVSGDGEGTIELPDGFPVGRAWIIAHDGTAGATPATHPWVTCVISGGTMRLDRFRSLTCSEYALSQCLDAAESHSFDEAFFKAAPSPIAQPTWERLSQQHLCAWNPEERAAIAIGDVYMGPKTASLWLGAKAAGIVLGKLMADEEGTTFDLGQLIRSKARVLVQSDEAHADDWARLGSLVDSDSRWVCGASGAIADLAVSDYARMSLAGREPAGAHHAKAAAAESPQATGRPLQAGPEATADDTMVIRALDPHATTSPHAASAGATEDWSDLE